MPRKLIAEQWNTYLIQVLPPSASITQRRETKRAFYAGAHSIFLAVMAAMSAGPEATDEDLTIMADIQAEAEAFARDVAAGLA